VNLKGRGRVGRLILLVILILAVSLVGFGCVKGLAPIGWSGGIVSDGSLFVGSKEGRLVAVNLADESRLWAEPLKPVSSTGFFGCSPAMGGGCGGASRVAIYGTPVIYEDLVYIAGYNGKIYAYNATSLGLRWVYPRESNLKPFVGGIAVFGDKLYIGGEDGKVYAFDAATGDLVWEFQTDDKIWGTPTLYNDTLYIGSFDKKLYALDAADGSLKWYFTAEGSVIATPLVYNDVLYIGSFDRHMYALNAFDGSLKWKFMGENWFWAEPVVVNDVIYAPCLDGKVYLLKAGNGAKVDEYDMDGSVSSRPVVVDGSVIITTRKGVVYSIATDTREIRQMADFEEDVDGPLTEYGGIVYIHTADLSLQRINAATGAILRPVSLESQ